MAYASKNKRKSLATSITFVYATLTFLVIIPHRFFSRYSHPTTLLTTAVVIVSLTVGFLIFVRQMNRWIEGRKINVIKTTYIIMTTSLVIAVMLDYTILTTLYGLPLYQTLFKILQVFCLVAIATLAIIIFIIIISRNVASDEKMERLFLPLKMKIYLVTNTLVITITYMLTGFVVYQTEASSIESMSNANRLEMTTMVSRVNDYVIYLIQNTKLDTDYLSFYAANNRTLSEEFLLENLTFVDDNAHDFYKEVEIHLDYGQQDVHISVTPTIHETLNITQLEHDQRLDLTIYQPVAQYEDMYINYNTIREDGAVQAYISIISIIRVNGNRVGHLKIVTSAKHLKNIIASYIYPLSDYYIYNPNTGNIISIHDTQTIVRGVESLFSFENWVEDAQSIHRINSDNPRLVVDARNVYYMSNDEHASYFLFAEHIGRLDIVFFQLIPTGLLFDVTMINDTFSAIIVGIMIFLIIILTLFSFLISYTIQPLISAVDYTNKLREEKKYVSSQLLNITNDEAGLILINTNAFFSSLGEVLVSLKEEGSSLDGDFSTLSEILNANIEILKNQISSVNETVDSISNVLTSISKVNDATTQQKYAFSSTNVAIDELLKVISTIEQNMEIQSSAVEQTSASIEEIISNISSVARNVNTADSYAKKLVEEGKTGGEIVDEVIDAVKEIEDNSDQIKEIINVIQGIAEQTNLLAMNAAIEAAHAGEQGKGFAIVADEIRSLAEHTADNTKSVTSIIREITKRVANTVSLAVGSGNSLDSIINISEKTARVVSEINIANSEIEIGGREILETVKNLNIITKKIKDGVDDQVQNSKIVEAQVSTLNSITENVSNAITESIVGSNHVNEGLESLTDLAGQSNGSNEALNDAISKLNVSFAQFNSFVDSFSIDENAIEESNKESMNENAADDLLSRRKIKRKKEKRKLSLRDIVEEIAFMEETGTNENKFDKQENSDFESEQTQMVSNASVEEVKPSSVSATSTNSDDNSNKSSASNTESSSEEADINDLFRGIGGIGDEDPMPPARHNELK